MDLGRRIVYSALARSWRMKSHLVRFLVCVAVVWSTTVLWRDDDAEFKLSHFACDTGVVVAGGEKEG